MLPLALVLALGQVLLAAHQVDYRPTGAFWTVGGATCGTKAELTGQVRAWPQVSTKDGGSD